MYFLRTTSFTGWKFFSTLLAGFVVVLTAGAQDMITLKEQQLIQEVSTERVKVFTKYLSLLAREKNEDRKQAYIKYINLSFVEQESPIRVYNDLLPTSVVEQNPILDQHLSLEDYLKQTSENYTSSLQLSFNNYQVRNICYSDHLKRYYVVVSAERVLSGMYRSGAQLVESKSEGVIDFFVHLSISPGEINVGGIFGFEPYQEREKYREVKVVNDQNLVRAEDGKIFRETLKVETGRRKIRIKRGKHHVLKWSGGLKDDIIEVELIPAGKEQGIDTLYFEPLRNERSVRVLINEDTRTGLYKFRIKNITTGRYTQTGLVKIKKKFLFFGSLQDKAATPADDFFLPDKGIRPFKSTTISYHS